MDMQIAIDVALDRAVEVLDHEEAGMMMVFGNFQGEYQFEYIQNPIPYAAIEGFSTGIEFLKPECVVFVVMKATELWVFVGMRDGAHKTMKVPFKLVDGDVVVDLPMDIDKLNCLPLELFWGDGR